MDQDQIQTQTEPKVLPNTHASQTMISIKKIRVKDRKRVNLGKIEELVGSIKQFGVINPIACYELPEPIEGKTHEILAGGRRWTAAALAGFTDVPVRIVPRPESGAHAQKLLREIELEENIQRENLSWAEQNSLIAEIDKLKTELYGTVSPKNPEGWTKAKTAQTAGVSPAKVSEAVKFAKKLEKRPDLLEKVKHLPRSAAVKAVKSIEDRERNQRLLESGKIQVSADLKNENCLDGIRALEPDSVDLILTDPPYANSVLESTSKQLKTKAEWKGQSYQAQLKTHDNWTEEGFRALMSDLIPELDRVLKPNRFFVMFFCWDQYEWLWQKISEQPSLVVSRTPVIWDKGKIVTRVTGRNFPGSYEPFLVGYKKPGKRMLSINIRDVQQFSPVGKTRVHPFQKPEDLLTKIIEATTNEGELVLDPFAGSASTLIAAKTKNRCSLGFELDADRWIDAIALIKQRSAEVEKVKQNSK